MEKIVKAQKDYRCVCCQGIIRKGQVYKHEKIRFPVFANGDDCNQTGVEYLSFRLHENNCQGVLIHTDKPKEVMKNCNFGKHSFIESFSGPDDYDSGFYCEWCGESEEEN